MKRSVALETTWFVVLTIALVALVEVFSHHFLTRHNQEVASKDAQTDLDTYALAVQQQINFYKRLLEGLSRRTDVQNLLEFGGQDEAFEWALNYRKLLPDTVGLTLINHDGEILGNPASLFIGQQCRADISSLSHGNNIAAPAVHRERAGMEHFDLFAPVDDTNGERLGHLFASFKLTVVQELLETMAHRGHKLAIVAADETPVASIDLFADTADDAFELTTPISGTDWRMTLLSRPAGMEEAATTLLLATSVLALFIGISVVLLSRHLSKGLLREIFSIRTALDQIAEGSDKAVDIQPHFRETAPVMDAVQEVSKRIQIQKESLRQLSETDSLTGLLNRRRFTQELEKAWALSTRGIPVYLVSLDVDGFKQVNDQHGHATGDQVLKSLADCLNDCVRATDMIARLGGDEFVILLLHSDEAAGLALFERLSSCFELAQTKLPIDAGQYCTLSAGLVNVDTDIDTDAEATLRRSDDALYRAKKAGRNQIRS